MKAAVLSFLKRNWLVGVHFRPKTAHF